MFPVLLSLGPITISTFGFFAVCSFVAASFYLWLKLRDDYQEEEVISLTIVLAIGAILGARILYIITHLSEFPVFKPLAWFALRQDPGLSFLGALLAGILVLYLWTKKKNWNLFLVADNLVFALFLVLVVCGIGLVLSTGESFHFAFFAVSLGVGGLALLFSKNYRKFIWYKSGKPGFSALGAFAIFLLGYLLLEIFFKRGVYWEKAIFALGSLFCLGLLYRRSERSLKEDIGNFILFCQNLIKKK